MIKKLFSRLGIFFLYLLSLLPFWFLYLISDLLFVVLYHVTRYRRKVVHENLKNSFPEKSDQERHDIERKYYRYLGDFIMETVKMISISAEDVQKRMKPTNPEIVDHYFKQGKSILAATGHYCNWEMAALSFGFLTHEKRIIIYKQQSNEVFNDFFNRNRSRFGSTMVSMKQTLRKMIEYKNELTFTVLVSDQTPPKTEANYFTNFLNQKTAVFLGIEKLTKVANCVVVFYKIELVKRGYYTYTLVPLVEHPELTEPYEITEAHVKFLEKIIKDEPQYWLWSHRRWKFKPESVTNAIVNIS